MLLQLVYASRPFGFDAGTLTAILFDARRCNTRDGITGALICRDDLFLQLLEGPEAAVEAAYARIRAGATAVQVYSALIYEGPGLVARIKRELAAALRSDGFSTVAEAVSAGPLTER